MARPKKSASEPALGYEAQLWQTADALRENMDAAEFRHRGSGSLSDSCLSGTSRA